MNPVAAWHTEHEYFRRLLGMLQEQVVRFHTGDTPNFDLVLDIVSYLRDYADEVHHPREEAAFALLAERCPGIKADLARLSQEHRVVARAGEKLQQLLRGALGDSVVSRTEVEVAAATYLVYYGNHIAKEEEDVLPRAAAVLTAQDWEAVKAAAPALDDPVFGGGNHERYRELRRQIAMEAQ